nr:hypothetical protein [Moraxella osloensis]
MIEINPNIIAIALRNQWHSETLEHYQEDEYYSLDFTNETDIRYAINKWLSIGWHNEIEKNIYKESLRYAITKDGYLDADVWLPNIDNAPETPNTPREDLNQWKVLYKKFLLILWDEWFHEPFVPANLRNYRVRTDFEFVNFPHVPEMWKQAQYAENS